MDLLRIAQSVIRQVSLTIRVIGETSDPGSVYLVLFNGVITLIGWDGCRSLDRFNKVVRDDPRVEHVLLPAFDGLNFIRVKSAKSS